MVPEQLGDDSHVFMQLPRQPGVYLRLVEGRCVFLAADKRCLIHKFFGPEFKPLICRMFPYLRVLTEDGYRLAVSPGCTRAHLHATRALGPVEHVARLDGEHGTTGGMVVARPISAEWIRHSVDDATRTYQQKEQVLIDLLGSPTHLRAVAAVLTSSSNSSTHSPSWRLAAEVCSHLQDHLRGLQAALHGSHTFVTYLAQQAGPFAVDVRALIHNIDACVSSDPIELTFDATLEASMLDSLRRFVFLRDGLDFPDFEHAVAGHLLGWTLALWVTRELHDPSDRHDACGAMHAVWYRLVTHNELAPQLFAHTHPAGFLASLAHG